MPPRIPVEEKHKPHSISIEDDIWNDIEFVSKDEYNFKKASPLIRKLIIDELRKTMSWKYKKTLKMLRKISLILVCMLLISSVDALQILNNSIEMNKTHGINKNITILIQNPQPFPFYNVSFVNNNIISPFVISEIQSGVTINKTITIITNESMSTTLKLIGFYATAVGHSNQIYKVNVTSFKSLPCDMTIIKGDSIEWKSFLQSEIIMFDVNTNLPVDGGVLTLNKTFLKVFNSPQQFRYLFKISNVPFPEMCIINVLDDTGTVHDPSFDAILNLKINMLFKPTILSIIIPETNYSLNVFEQTQGVLSLRNNGNETARNVVLQADGFIFSDNNFDIIPEQSRALTYTIKPSRFISSTEQTNKTYIKNLSISGNFDVFSIPITIFVKYALISSNTTFNSTGETILDIVRRECDLNPSHSFCNLQPRIIFRNGSDSTDINITMSKAQLDALVLALLEFKETFNTESNIRKELQLENAQYNKNSTIRLGSLDTKIESVEEKIETNFNLIWLIIITILLIIVILFLVYIIYYKIRKKQEAVAVHF